MYYKRLLDCAVIISSEYGLTQEEEVLNLVEDTIPFLERLRKDERFSKRVLKNYMSWKYFFGEKINITVSPGDDREIEDPYSKGYKQGKTILPLKNKGLVGMTKKKPIRRNFAPTKPEREDLLETVDLESEKKRLAAIKLANKKKLLQGKKPRPNLNKPAETLFFPPVKPVDFSGLSGKELLVLCENPDLDEEKRGLCDDGKTWYNLLKKDFAAGDIILNDDYPKNTYKTINGHYEFFRKHKLVGSSYDLFIDVLRNLLLTGGVSCLEHFLDVTKKLENVTSARRVVLPGDEERAKEKFHDGKIISSALIKMVSSILDEQDYETLKPLFSDEFFGEFSMELGDTFFNKNFNLDHRSANFVDWLFKRFAEILKKFSHNELQYYKIIIGKFLDKLHTKVKRNISFPNEYIVIISDKIKSFGLTHKLKLRLA